MEGKRPHRSGPLLAAMAVLALTAGATVLLTRLDHGRAGERGAVEAQAAALRVADGVRSLIGGLEGQTHNATTNPRLIAALDAGVDQETLRDLLLTEPWWEPMRRDVDGFGLYAVEGGPLVSSRLPASFDARTMVREAHQAHHASTGLVVASGQVVAVAACPVALTGRSDRPVLVATKILDVGLMSGMAERAGGAVGISDGRRLLVAATMGAAGGADDLAALKQALDLQAPGLLPVGSQTVAALPLSSGLRVLVGVAARTSAPGSLPLPWPALAILSIGVSFAIGLYLMLLRHAPEPSIAALVPAPMPTPGDALVMIGRYTIVERIGLGGMAEIYAAVTQGEGSFRRPVVIKRLRPELSIDANAVTQFCDEANLLAALHHPNIVAVHDFGRSQGHYFLAEEYVVGRDLGRAVARRFERAHLPAPTEVIAFVAVELLKALDYAHGLTNELGHPLGIVHRDVSPENVMVSARGEVKLLDFGVVKVEGRLARTEVGVVKGNVAYMAPEQARGLEVDARADLFSVALVIYTLATGKPLYGDDTTYGLLMKAGAGPGVEDRSAIRELPNPLAAVVDKATATRLEDRYQNARAMSADLEAAARNGAAATAALVVELFGADLKDEAHRMATFAPHHSTRPVIRLSSG
jgi:hypothetical protein